MVPENSSGRPIDEAMGGDSKPKDRMREFWADLVADFQNKVCEAGELLYLSLPGGEGRDIELLVEKGILQRTESGALSDDSQKLVAAVESDGLALAELQSRFTGLKIYQNPINDLLRGEKLTKFPEGKERNFVKARIINLDFNKSLSDNPASEDGKFPVAKIIKKIGTIQKEEGHEKWALCVTFNGTLNWEEVSFLDALTLIRQNCDRFDKFRESLVQLVGEESVAEIENGGISCDQLNDVEFSHVFLAAFLPKIIADELMDQKWVIETQGVYRYYSEKGAPMNSWIFKLSLGQEDLVNSKLEIYQRNVESLFQNCFYIDDQGELSCE